MASQFKSSLHLVVYYSYSKMKLFILAALIAVSSAARLEHLEQQQQLRQYLPPHQGGRGQGSFGSQSSFQSNDLGSGDSVGFGSAPQGSRTGPANFRGQSSFAAAQSNQYLPPDHGPSGSQGFGFSSQNSARGQDSFGASSNQNQFGSQSQFGQSNGFGAQGSNAFGSHGASHGAQGASHGAQGASHGAQGASHGAQGASHGAQGASHGAQGASHGSSGFGSHGASQGSNGFGSHGASQGSHGFGSQGASNSFGSQGSKGFGSQFSGFGSQGSNGFGSSQSQQASSLRQYLAPKTSHDQIPQQAFDEQTGYHY